MGEWKPLSPKEEKNAKKHLGNFKKALDKEFKKGKFTAKECKEKVRKKKIELGLQPPPVDDTPAPPVEKEIETTPPSEEDVLPLEEEIPDSPADEMSEEVPVDESDILEGESIDEMSEEVPVEEGIPEDEIIEESPVEEDVPPLEETEEELPIEETPDEIPAEDPDIPDEEITEELPVEDEATLPEEELIDESPEDESVQPEEEIVEEIPPEEELIDELPEDESVQPEEKIPPPEEAVEEQIECQSCGAILPGGDESCSICGEPVIIDEVIPEEIAEDMDAVITLPIEEPSIEEEMPVEDVPSPPVEEPVEEIPLPEAVPPTPEDIVIGEPVISEEELPPVEEKAGEITDEVVDEEPEDVPVDEPVEVPVEEIPPLGLEPEEEYEEVIEEGIECPSCTAFLPVDTEVCTVCGQSFVLEADEESEDLPVEKEAEPIPVVPVWVPLPPKELKKAEKQLHKDTKPLDKALKKGELTQEDYEAKVKEFRIIHKLEPPEPQPPQEEIAPPPLPEEEMIEEPAPPDEKIVEELPPEDVPVEEPAPPEEEIIEEPPPEDVPVLPEEEIAEEIFPEEVVVEVPIEKEPPKEPEYEAVIEEGIECPSCGAFLPLDAEVCTVCGTAIIVKEEPIEKETPSIIPIPVFVPLSSKEHKKANKQLHKAMKSLDKDLKRGEITQDEYDAGLDEYKVQYGLEPPPSEEVPLVPEEEIPVEDIPEEVPVEEVPLPPEDITIEEPLDEEIIEELPPEDIVIEEPVEVKEESAPSEEDMIVDVPIEEEPLPTEEITEEEPIEEISVEDVSHEEEPVEMPELPEAELVPEPEETTEIELVEPEIEEEPAEAEIVTPLPVTERNCPSCGALISSTADECPICSEPFDEPVLDEDMDEVIEMPDVPVIVGLPPPPEDQVEEAEDVEIQPEEPLEEEPTPLTEELTEEVEAEEEPVEPIEEVVAEEEPVEPIEEVETEEPPLVEDVKEEEPEIPVEPIDELPESEMPKPVEEPEKEISVEEEPAMDEISCPKCGAFLEVGTTECFICGAILGTEEVPEEKEDVLPPPVEEPEEVPIPVEKIPEKHVVDEITEEEHIECPSCGAALEAAATECFLCGKVLVAGVELGIPAPEEPVVEEPEMPLIDEDLLEDTEIIEEDTEIIEITPTEEETETSELAKNEIMCPSCSSVITADSVKCPECWTDLSLYTRCSSCDAPIPIDAEFCPNCYAKIEKEEAEEEIITREGKIDAMLDLEIEELEISEELEQEMTILEQEDENAVECLVCGALMDPGDEHCPICGIEYGLEIEEIPEPEREWEGIDVVIEPTQYICPHCGDTIVGVEESPRETAERKWFLRGIMTIFIGFFFTSFSVWLRGMTFESRSVGEHPPPLDLLVNLIGMILVAVGFVFWYMSSKLNEEKVECPECGIEITPTTEECVYCGTVFIEKEDIDEEILAEDIEVEALAEEILAEEIEEEVIIAEEIIEDTVGPSEDVLSEDKIRIEDDLRLIEEELGITEDVLGEEPEEIPPVTDGPPVMEEAGVQDEALLDEITPSLEDEITPEDIEDISDVDEFTPEEIMDGEYPKKPPMPADEAMLGVPDGIPTDIKESLEEEHIDCPSCGAALEATATECFLCGEAVGKSEDEEETVQSPAPVEEVVPEEEPVEPAEEVTPAVEEKAERVQEEVPSEPKPMETPVVEEAPPTEDVPEEPVKSSEDISQVEEISELPPPPEEQPDITPPSEPVEEAPPPEDEPIPTPDEVPEEPELGTELPIEHEEHKKCLGCGIFVDASATECPVCDTPFDEPEVTEPEIEMELFESEEVVSPDAGSLRCPSCGAALEAGTPQCFLCGTEISPFDTTIPAEPKEPIEIETPEEKVEEKMECPMCGAIIDTTAKVCPICEEQLI